MAHAHGPMRRNWPASPKKRPLSVGLGGLSSFGEFGRRVPKSGRRRNRVNESLRGRYSIASIASRASWIGLAGLEAHGDARGGDGRVRQVMAVREPPAAS